MPWRRSSRSSIVARCPEHDHDITCLQLGVLVELGEKDTGPFDAQHEDTLVHQPQVLERPAAQPVAIANGELDDVVLTADVDERRPIRAVPAVVDPEQATRHCDERTVDGRAPGERQDEQPTDDEQTGPARRATRVGSVVGDDERRDDGPDAEVAEQHEASDHTAPYRMVDHRFRLGRREPDAGER